MDMSKLWYQQHHHATQLHVMQAEKRNGVFGPWRVLAKAKESIPQVMTKGFGARNGILVEWASSAN